MTSNENDEKAEAERCAQEMSLVYDMLQRLDSSDGDVSKKVEHKGKEIIYQNLVEYNFDSE